MTDSTPSWSRHFAQSKNSQTSVWACHSESIWRLKSRTMIRLRFSVGRRISRCGMTMISWRGRSLLLLIGRVMGRRVRQGWLPRLWVGCLSFYWKWVLGCLTYYRHDPQKEEGEGLPGSRGLWLSLGWWRFHIRTGWQWVFRTSTLSRNCISTNITSTLRKNINGRRSPAMTRPWNPRSIPTFGWWSVARRIVLLRLEAMEIVGLTEHLHLDCWDDCLLPGDGVILCIHMRSIHVQWHSFLLHTTPFSSIHFSGQEPQT